MVTNTTQYSIHLKLKYLSMSKKVIAEKDEDLAVQILRSTPMKYREGKR